MWQARRVGKRRRGARDRLRAFTDSRRRIEAMQVDDRRRTHRRCRESREQLAVDAAETAVAHHEHVIAGARLGGDGADQRIEIVVDDGLRAERGERGATSQPRLAA